ncbi:MAG: hypothetical protein L0H83_04075 [Salinisphaera sp.]|nr:hypothetical protein [Salinisphaera sp.]
MSRIKLDYPQLLETNNLLQINGDETYWLCVTRTVQESKLFPVPAYMMLSYAMAFYRYPALLAKIEQHMSAEEIGDRVRNLGVRCQAVSMWGLPCFYLLGREWLINLGLIRPQDAAEDVAYVLDFWKRFQLSWRRNHGHITAKEAGHRAQTLPERQLQVFHADLYDCAAGDELHEAAHTFVASASQYAFLIACESRISLHNTGPYKLSDNQQMLVRDFMDLAQCDLPWLDGVAADVPYNNLTVTMAARDCHFNILDDWGSFESEPEFKSEHLCGVGLYTSDALTDGYVPVGMGSAEELARTFRGLNETVKDATTRLWQRIAGFSRDQMLDAGAMTYYAIIKDLAHIAGCYDPDDWMQVDERAEVLRPLLNDEYSRDVLGMLCIGLGPSHQCSEYTMMQHSDLPQRIYSPIPYSILKDGDYAPTVGGLAPALTYLDPKEDHYRTSQGMLSVDEYNRRVREHQPAYCDDDHRFLCETWVKYHHETKQADELYQLHQKGSRKLEGTGAGLKRADIEALRQQQDH